MLLLLCFLCFGTLHVIIISRSVECISFWATVTLLCRQSPTRELNLAASTYLQLQLDTAERAAC